ncbi:hypothetical protein H9P43_001180 [Blastocladiella emersonii ATCC 22665]|nr:hypothetical protein H9P43_001180 [Blastocladiella emersonii ATCC 22665]
MRREGISRAGATFGVASLHPDQFLVLSELMDGKKVIFTARTGYGKSMLFFAMTLLRPGMLVIVFSPYRALLFDQVRQAKEKGVKCCSLSSDATEKERQEHMTALAEGAIQLVFMTPEHFADHFHSNWHRLDRAPKVSAIVLDEAHLIAKWYVP